MPCAVYKRSATHIILIQIWLKWPLLHLHLMIPQNSDMLEKFDNGFVFRISKSLGYT